MSFQNVELTKSCEKIVCGSREDWLAERRRGIGSSDAAAIAGVGFRGPLTVFHAKRGLESDFKETPQMRWGKIHEPAIAAAFQEETGRAVHDPGDWTIYRSRTYPWLQCTPDRLQRLPHGDAGVLELKTTSAHLKDRWEEDVPLAYQIQLQHQLLVLGLDAGTIACLIGGNDFRWKDYEQHEVFRKAHIELMEQFWRRVEQDNPPPARGKDLDVLKKLLLPKKKTIVQMPGDAACVAGKLARVRKKMRALKEEAKEHEAQLRQWLGTAERGKLMDTGEEIVLVSKSRAESVVRASSWTEVRLPRSFIPEEES